MTRDLIHHNRPGLVTIGLKLTDLNLSERTQDKLVSVNHKPLENQISVFVFSDLGQALPFYPAQGQLSA
jgi:hypothetical protein